MHHYFCSGELRTLLTHHLAAFEPALHSTDNLRHAAVALTIVDSSGEINIPGVGHMPDRPDRAALILTRRAPKLSSHSGQWALPGGSLDPGETVEEAALRELHEEVGLELGAENIIGRLDDFTTRSGFVMSPVVVWGGCDLELYPDPREVASVHRIPLDELMRSDAPQLRTFPDNNAPVPLMPIGLHTIAPPTGAMLYQFREVALRGNDTRVAHFEQPRFAWK